MIKKLRVLNPRSSRPRACMLNHSLYCLLGVKTRRKHLTKIILLGGCLENIQSVNPPDISNFSLGSGKNVSKLYSHQLDTEGHYNLMLKDKTNLTQRCCGRHHALPWHSILLTKTHGEILPVTLSIRKSCILLNNHFICKCEQSKFCSYLFSIFIMAARNCWAKFISHMKRPSRTTVCNKSFGVPCSLLALLVSYLYSPLVLIPKAYLFYSFLHSLYHL